MRFIKKKILFLIPILLIFIIGFFVGFIKSSNLYLYPKYIKGSLNNIVIPCLVFIVVFIIIWLISKIVKREWFNYVFILFTIIIYLLSFLSSSINSNLAYHYSSTNDFNNYLKIDNSEIRRMIEDHFPKKEDLEGYNNEYYYYYRCDPIVLVDCKITIIVEYKSDYEIKVMELLDKYPTICSDDVIKIYDYIDTNNHIIKLFIIFDNVKKTIEFHYSNTL